LTFYYIHVNYSHFESRQFMPKIANNSALCANTSTVTDTRSSRRIDSG